MKSFVGDSANSVWVESVGSLLTNSGGVRVQSRNGAVLEFMHTVLTVRDPRNRWIVSRQPPLNPAFALAEVIWILCGRNDTRFLTHWFHNYPNFVGHDPEQHGAYGYRLRHHFGCDQLRQATAALQKNPDTRQVVLQIWSCGDDLPLQDGQPKSSDIPCNIVCLPKIREGRLEWLQVIRSNDVDRGVPHNVIQFTMLQELMAGWLGIGVGEYVQISDSFHWYEAASARLDVDQNVEPEVNTDHFVEPLDTSLAAFDELNDRLDGIIRCRQVGTRPPDVVGDLPTAYEHMYLLLAADDARRYGESQRCLELAGAVRNPALKQVWERWLESVGFPKK